jgi:hypothetical protein
VVEQFLHLLSVHISQFLDRHLLELRAGCLDELEGFLDLACDVELDGSDVEGELVLVIGFHHDLSHPVEGGLLGVEHHCMLHHLRRPAVTVLVVKISKGILRVQQSFLYLLPGNVVLAGKVKPAGYSLGYLEVLLLTVGEFDEFEEIVDLKFVKFGPAVSQQLKKILFLKLSFDLDDLFVAFFAKEMLQPLVGIFEKFADDVVIGMYIAESEKTYIWMLRAFDSIYFLILVMP